MRKSAALCEAFGVKYEPHSYGCTSICAAHFHVMLAMHNCDWVELPVPLHLFEMGMKDVLKPTPDGYADAPTKPGLGVEVDLDAIDKLTVGKL